VAELDALREKQMAAKEKTLYDGTWRPAPGKVLPPVPEGVPPVLRFMNPPEGERGVGRQGQGPHRDQQPTRSTTW
jgi:hypothetical protein